MKKLWHSTLSSTVRPQSVQPVVANGFTKAAARRMAMYDSRKPGANFECPSCKHFFYLHYGVLGTFTFFADPAFHCRDCAKKSGFTKAK